MARSYKKTPILKDRNPYMKTFANRIVRRRLSKPDYGLANGKAYRKVVNSWDICDWVFRRTYREYQKGEEIAKKQYENGITRLHGYYEFIDGSYWDWYKKYKRK